MAKTKTPSGRNASTSQSLPHGSSISSKQSSTERNASGYRRRIESKAQRAGTNEQDLYEYTAAKNKRAKVALDVDRDELAGQGPRGYKGKGTARREEEDGEDEGIATLQKKVAANMEGDLGVVESEDDEEIESDDAFEGESDEERFRGFKFKEKKMPFSLSHAHKSRISRDVNLDEDEAVEDDDSEIEDDAREGSEEDDDLGEEGGPAITLSTMLDVHPDEMDSRSDSQSKSGSEDDSVEVLAVSDTEDAFDGEVDALANLDSFIDGLSTSHKRKATDTGDHNPTSAYNRPRKKRIIPEQTQAGAESEFAVSGGAKERITIEDLLKPLSSVKTHGTVTSLEKTAKLLLSSKAKPLAAPLHTRQQERLDREAAYDATKEEVEKWAPTMKRIKQAEHLSFPLQRPAVVKPSTAEMISNFKPSTELESTVDQLLKSAQLRESDIEKTEELQMSHFTLEEVAARRAELRQMRELMFRADAKAKRVAKIKSKTYRKIQKKLKEKNALTLEQIQVLDPEAAEAERIKGEATRAKERATMRHKNTGKWAKQMLSRPHEIDVDQRRELNAQLERGEQLRRKIQGLNDDEESEDDGDSRSDDVDAEDPIAGIASRAFDELSTVGDCVINGSIVKKKKGGGGLLDMKFMRDAAAREEAEADAIANDFRTELLGLGRDPDNTRSAVPDPLGEEASSSSLVQNNQGRLIFRPATGQSISPSTPLVPHKSAGSDASSTTLKSSIEDLTEARNIRFESVNHASTSVFVPASENPWLAVGSSSSAKVSRRKNEVVISKESSAGVKSQASLKKRLRKSDVAISREADDTVVEIDLSDVMVLPSSTTGSQLVATSKVSKGQPESDISDKAAIDVAFRHSDDEGDDVEERTQKGSKVFEQRDLVALAFAGDNIVEEFKVRKQNEIEAEAPKEINATLPGWGIWGGRGVKKSNNTTRPDFVKKIAGVAPHARADSGKAHLILSEKKDKKASRYLVKDLPYPYTSKAQFEKSLDQPVGAEWNTRMTFQKGTLPRVVKKIGTIIDPIQRAF